MELMREQGTCISGAEVNIADFWKQFCGIRIALHPGWGTVANRNEIGESGIANERAKSSLRKKRRKLDIFAIVLYCPFLTTT